MSQPTPYVPSFSFTDFQTLHPVDPPPGQNLDIEYGNVQITLNQVLANLKVIQRDDTQIANQTIGLVQLKPEITVGFNPPQTWVTGHSYGLTDTVFNTSAFYRCIIAHTSGVFATDLAAGDWQLIVDLSTLPVQAATQISFSPPSYLVSTNVQTALVEVSSVHGIPCSITQSLYVANADLTGTTPVDDTIPQIGEGTQILSVTTPTPASSSSKYLIHFGGQLTCATATVFVVSVFRGAGANAITARTGVPAAGLFYDLDMLYLDSPASATPVTYTVRLGSAAGTTFRLNGATNGRYLGGSASADLTVIEIR